MVIDGRLTIVFATEAEMADAVANAVQSDSFTLVTVDEEELRVVVDVHQGP